ncbi:hypothetical protein, partial [Pseudomonas syringae group genomosp. 7]|uniref:hypothetical protein n=1 Tax=Pseudomonas syringae group genomosp. 7 TaxID=251699 RepID=UPI00376F4CC6
VGGCVVVGGGGWVCGCVGGGVVGVGGLLGVGGVWGGCGVVGGLGVGVGFSGGCGGWVGGLWWLWVWAVVSVAGLGVVFGGVVVWFRVWWCCVR